MLCFLFFKLLLLRNSSSPFNHMTFSAFLFLLNPFIFLVLFCNLVLTHSFYMTNLSQNIVFTLIIIYIHTHFKYLILHSLFLHSLFCIMFLPDIPNSHFYITKWEEACSYAQPLSLLWTAIHSYNYYPSLFYKHLHIFKFLHVSPGFSECSTEGPNFIDFL